MPTSPETTSDLRREQNAQNAQLDVLLDTPCECPDDKWLKRQAMIKRVIAKINSIDQALQPPGIRIPAVVVTAQSSSMPRRQFQ